MCKIILSISLLVVVIYAEEVIIDYAAQQLPLFKNSTQGPIGILTTSYGVPVDVKDTSALNSNLIHNVYFMESLIHLVHERIPERAVHAIGAGAFGYFEVTHNISHICKAKLFKGIGKTTPVAVRFSPVGGGRGGSDTTRGVKGFAIKFYTEEGNYDLVCLNTPVFVMKDPIKFPTLVHAGRRNPVNNLPDVNMLWDFFTSTPESLHSFLLTQGDTGISDGFRRLPGFGVHTFQVVGDAGDVYFVRFHVLPEGGIERLLPEEIQRLTTVDPNYSTRDLYNAIANGDYPCWILSIQVLTLEDVKNAPFNVFDITIELPEDKYPLHPVGKLILNKNPNNYFADIEQLSFNPGNLIPGIAGASDSAFESRRLTYKEAAIHRLGINHNNIPVNCPIYNPPLNYLRDGVPPVGANGGSGPNYYPNTFNGPVPRPDHKRTELIKVFIDDSYSFDQVRNLYVNKMTEDERSRVVQNIIATLSRAVPRLQEKAVNLFTEVHPDLGNRIFQSLQENASQV